MDYAIVSENLTKIFKSKKKEVVAVDHISLKIKRGEFFGLLGPNGAGKTTYTKMLVTLLIPDEGEAWIDGFSILKEPVEVRKRVGWMMGETGGRALYWRLSGYDNLMFFARLQNVPKDVAKRRINAMIKFLGLEKDIHKLVMNYSTGMRVKLMLIRALIHNPDILILDEPTLGLDVESARNVRMLLRELVDRAKKTILFTSHNMQEVEMLCDRMAVINRGKIIFLGTPRELREKVADMKVVEIRLVEDKGVLEDIIKKLEQLPVVNGILSKEVSERNIVIRVLVTDYFTAIPEITSTLREYNIESVQRMLPTLEEAFLKLAGTEPRV
ncbi:MAG: ABC transporter ATP-binding protein [Crenarchaeota archaeon]|nr:ABC transporter ATP-binding protein [Thermoproteota archaeon]MCR8501287.1 ABC transporter ATP-binding protein [Thermoproteota archaeon]